MGTVFCKHGELEEGIRERAVKGRCFIGSLARIMREKNVSMDVEIVKELYSPANTDIWIKDLDIKKGTTIKNVSCRNKIVERII